ncbi:hypothetical protein [Pararhizobium sp. IMCC21322]|uniref:hypothetical protein n=1 Tax=Pararhizobium sp. IMCC21322 TaxID=3067903 RepID=UPI00274269A7|nr:hypothetical protein [Pararhizobium sp. IMCC21322]
MTKNLKSFRSAGRIAASALLAAMMMSHATPSLGGDFGREDSGVMDRKILPLIGGFVARYREEPVSYFNLTDEEKLLRQQARRLIAPPHARDWIHAIASRVQRYRVTAPLDHRLSTNAYYAYLRSDRFRSTAGRYGRLSADMAADAALIPAFFARANQVTASDTIRIEAVATFGPYGDERFAVQSPLLRPTTSVQTAAYARVYENKELIDWADRAVAFRIESYRNAIERLAIEEPDERVGLADGELQRLELIFRKARLAYMQPGVKTETVRRSRYMTGRDTQDQAFDPYDAPVPQK